MGIFFTETSGNSSPGVAEPNGGRRHKRSTVTPGAATLSDLIMPHVEAYCLTVLPPEAEYRRLETIFYTKIHPLFPAIPSSLVSPERTDATVVLYKQAICLAAAADPSSAPYLRLCLPGQQEVPKRPLTTQTFHKHLSSAIRLELSLDVVLVPDRVSLIRILSLVSMFIQPATADEADIASELQGRAIQHVETLGLHLRGYRSVQPREGQEREGHKGRDEADDILSLFLAVWALDRINAAVYGRPCLLHERDLRQDLNESIAKQEPCFRVFLNLVQQLDKIIHLYRPAIDVPDARKIDIDVPVLEDLLVEAGATKLPSALIGAPYVAVHCSPC